MLCGKLRSWRTFKKLAQESRAKGQADCLQDIRKAESGKSSGCAASLNHAPLFPLVQWCSTLASVTGICEQVRLHETFFHEANGERLFCIVCEAMFWLIWFQCSHANCSRLLACLCMTSWRRTAIVVCGCRCGFKLNKSMFHPVYFLTTPWQGHSERGSAMPQFSTLPSRRHEFNSHWPQTWKCHAGLFLTFTATHWNPSMAAKWAEATWMEGSFSVIWVSTAFFLSSRGLLCH